MKRLLLPCLAILATASSAAVPRAGFRLDEALPESTLFYAEIPNSAAFRDVFKKTRIYALLNDEEFQQFIKPAWGAFVKEFDEAAKDFEKKVGVPWDKVWELASEQSAFAIVSPGAKEDVEPDFILTLDGSGQGATWRKLVAFLKERYEKESGKRAEIWKAGDLEVVGGRLVHDIPFHLCVKGDALIAATQKSTLEAVLKGSDKPLVRSERFQAAKKRAAPPQSGAAVFVYANIPALVGAVRARVGESEQRAIDALGFGSFTYGAGAIVPGADMVSENFHIGVSGERKGLAKFLSMKGAAPDFANAPAGALEFASVSLDLAELWDTVLDVSRAIDEFEHQKFTENIERFEKEAGVSIKNDILGSLGSRVYGYLLLPDEGLVPDAVTVYEIRDREKLDKTLRLIAKNLDAELAAVEWQGHRIEYFKYNRASEDPFRMVLSTIYFTRTDTHLYATGTGSILSGMGVGTPNALKRMLLRKGKGTLAETKELQAWVGGRTGGASAVLYVDFERAFNVTYNTIAPLGAFFREAARSAGFEADLMKLPLGETIARSLSKSVTFVSVDGEGLTLTSRSGSGVTLMTAVYGGGLGALAIPVAARQALRSKTTQCQSNLYMLSYAANVWKTQKGSDFPDKTGQDFLKALSDAGGVTEEYTKCPHSGKPYRGPAQDANKAAEDDVIVADDPESHPDGTIHVLFRNGSVRSVKKDDPIYKKALDVTK